MGINGIGAAGYPVTGHTARKEETIDIGFREAIVKKAGQDTKADYDEKAFEFVGVNAPEEVRQAWMEAAEEVSANGLGVKKDGMCSHISQMMVQSLNKMLKGETDNLDILGNTIESAIRATEQALYDLEHPRVYTPKSIEVQQAQMKEREFYALFLEKLGNRTEADFSENVKAAGAKNVIHIDPDALFSIHHAKTGESAYVYRADDYSEDNPVYLVKGTDKDGKEYEQSVDVSEVNPNSCSYTEMLALNAHTGNKSDSNFMTMSILKDKTDGVSYHEKADYMTMAYELMDDMKILGNWDGYLRYGKWMNDILDFYKGNS